MTSGFRLAAVGCVLCGLCGIAQTAEQAGSAIDMFAPSSAGGKAVLCKSFSEDPKAKQADVWQVQDGVVVVDGH